MRKEDTESERQRERRQMAETAMQGSNADKENEFLGQPPPDILGQRGEQRLSVETRVSSPMINVL